MKQIIQNLKSGETILEEIPTPQVKRGSVLIRTTRSLVSLGTEKMLVEFGKSSLIQKARQQPDKVKMVLDKIKSDGLVPTLEAVFNKLDAPLPLGYCNVGEVIGVGEGVTEFSIGDRVASNGNHAEVVNIPKNLVAKIPENVSDEEASFTVVGAIGLQGIRLINPTLGETIVVSGLGLIGLLSAELLIANGCRVIGFDFEQKKVDLAREKGIEAFNLADGDDPVQISDNLTSGNGVDGVLITASTKSNDLISQAAKMSRKRGRIVLVGVIGLDISRADFYEKELSFQVSCSYGPGRYDDNYEQKGIDYPMPFVRWTEKRNFEAILQAMANGKLDVKSLITERIKLEEYQKIYSQMGGGSIASILEYTCSVNMDSVVNHFTTKSSFSGDKDAGIGIIGAGNFTQMTVLPTVKKLNLNLQYIASSGGLSAVQLAKKYNIINSTTDYKEILKSDKVSGVIITTRHNAHASMTLEAIKNHKHVLVEKPLTLNEVELNEIKGAMDVSRGSITVGFNRRFSPLAVKMKSLLGKAPGPMNLVATMNAGHIPKDVWVHDMQTGGGRIIGEACHYVDLLSFFAGSNVKSVCMNSMGENPDISTDNASILLKFENGSNGVINYLANGHKSYSKERVEIYNGGRTLILDNFRELKGYGFKGFSSQKSKQDKGHKSQFELFNNYLKSGGRTLVSFDSLYNTTLTTFKALESLQEGCWKEVK